MRGRIHIPDDIRSFFAVRVAIRIKRANGNARRPAAKLGINLGNERCIEHRQIVQRIFVFRNDAAIASAALRERVDGRVLHLAGAFFTVEIRIVGPALRGGIRECLIDHILRAFALGETRSVRRDGVCRAVCTCIERFVAVIVPPVRARGERTVLPARHARWRVGRQVAPVTPFPPFPITIPAAVAPVLAITKHLALRVRDAVLVTRAIIVGGAGTKPRLAVLPVHARSAVRAGSMCLARFIAAVVAPPSPESAAPVGSRTSRTHAVVARRIAAHRKNGNEATRGRPAVSVARAGLKALAAFGVAGLPLTAGNRRRITEIAGAVSVFLIGRSDARTLHTVVPTFAVRGTHMPRLPAQGRNSLPREDSQKRKNGYRTRNQQDTDGARMQKHAWGL